MQHLQRDCSAEKRDVWLLDFFEKFESKLQPASHLELHYGVRVAKWCGRNVEDKGCCFGTSPRSTSSMLCDMAFVHSNDPMQIPLSFAMSWYVIQRYAQKKFKGNNHLGKNVSWELSPRNQCMMIAGQAVKQTLPVWFLPVFRPGTTLP